MPENAPPAARAAHRAGQTPGGSSAPCPPYTEAGLRSRLLWLSVLPAVLVAILAAAAVVYVVVTAGTPVPDRTIVVLVSAWVGCTIVLAVAARRAHKVAQSVGRSVSTRIDAVRSSVLHGRAELHQLGERVRRGERPELSTETPPVRKDDAFGCLERDLDEVLRAARAVVAEAVTVRPTTTNNPSGQQVEVFVNLARRLQSLVHREIQLLDELENQVEDPDLLKGLFQVDHLATRIRRHAENLAVLGGAVSRRQWSRPVALTEVLRSAIAEVQHYSRVKLVPPIEGTVEGHSVADIIHLVAELVENATMFSPPQTQVLLRAQMVTAGVAVEVEDRGLGLSLNDQERLNRLLVDPAAIDIGELLRDGRIGLFVVSAIARRHGITARLQTNIYGGIQAVIILPHGLLGAAPQAQEQSRQQNQPQQSVPSAAHREPLARRESSALTANTAAVPVRTLAVPQIGSAAPAPLTAPAPAPATAPLAAPAPATATGGNGVHRDRPAAAPPAWEPTAPASTGKAAQRGADTGVRPPLPRRQRQTHLAPQLQNLPSAAPEVSTADHDPQLMASFMRGVSQCETGVDRKDDSAGQY